MSLCKYFKDCPDMKRLAKSESARRVDEILSEQYHELCSAESQEGCSWYERFEKGRVGSAENLNLARVVA